MKRQMYIPEIGNVIKLEKDWKFTLYCEYRNEKLFEAISKEKYNYRADGQDIEVTLPKGATLTIDRIYIRQGLSNYSSLSFYLDCPAISSKRLRFWAKLVDVNNIVFSIESKEEPLKLECRIADIYEAKAVHFLFEGGDAIRAQIAPIQRVFSTGDRELVFEVVLSWDVEVFEYESTNWIGMKIVQSGRRYKNVKYELQAVGGGLIQTFTTRDALMKKARAIYKEQNAAAIKDNNQQ